MTAADATGHPWRGLVLVSLAGVIWGTIGPGVRLVHAWSGLAPVTISAYRAAVAAVVLLGACLLKGRIGTGWSSARVQWRRVTAVGLLTALYQLLYFVAVVATGVSVATVVCLGFAPVLLLILDCARRRRPPSAGSAVTVGIAVVGLLLVSVAGGPATQAPHPVLGIVTALGSGGAYAMSAMISGPLTRRLDTLTVTTATMTVAAVALVPTGLLLTFLRGQTMITTDVPSWLGIGYLGVITMAVAYALLFTGLRDTPSGAAVVATLLEPVAAVGIAVAFLHERLTLSGLIGCLLIIAAIATLGRRSAEPRPQ